MMEDKSDEQITSSPEDGSKPKAAWKIQRKHNKNGSELDQDLDPVTELNETLDQQSGRTKRLQTLLRESNSKKKALEDELTKSKSVLNKLTDELAKVRSEFNAYVAASKEGIMNLGKENEKLKKEILERADKIVELESKVMMLSQLGVMSSEDADTLKDELIESSAKLRGENDALRQALKKAEEKTLSDARKLHQLQDQLRTHLEDKGKFSTDQKHLQLELEALQNDFAALEQKFLETQAIKTQLENQMAEEEVMQVTLRKAREKVREQKEIIDGLKAHISDLQGKYGATLHQIEMLDEKEEEINQLSSKLDKYRTKLTELKYQRQIMDEQKQLLVKTQDELAKTQEQYDQARLELQRFEMARSTLQKKEELIKRLREELTTFKAKVAELNAEVETTQKYQEQLHESQDAVSDLMSRIAGMATKVTKLKSELKKTVKERDRKHKEQQNEIIQLNEQVGSLQAENELKTTEIEALQIRAKDAETQVSAVQESLSRTLDLGEKLDAFSAESTKRKLSLEKRLEVFEVTANGLAQMKEELIREKEVLKEKVYLSDTFVKVLQQTDLGRVFLIVKALGETNVDHLSRALGIPKLNLLPSVRELDRMGVISFKRKKVAFIAPDMGGGS
ncbi:MAG: hypothetical protein ACE5I5_10500 [Candidatus Heimdallarchaeota archaeon]